MASTDCQQCRISLIGLVQWEMVKRPSYRKRTLYAGGFAFVGQSTAILVRISRRKIFCRIAAIYKHLRWLYETPAKNPLGPMPEVLQTGQTLCLLPPFYI